MFSSHHSHDAMRRLLKAAVGVVPKSEIPATMPDGSPARTASGTPGETKSGANCSALDSKGPIRT